MPIIRNIIVCIYCVLYISVSKFTHTLHFTSYVGELKSTGHFNYHKLLPSHFKIHVCIYITSLFTMIYHRSPQYFSNKINQSRTAFIWSPSITSLKLVHAMNTPLISLISHCYIVKMGFTRIGYTFSYFCPKTQIVGTSSNHQFMF